MPGHTTQRAAATTLGLHEQVLSRHRQHIEHATGIRIFQPGHPLTPTPTGARFLDQATRALRQLDLTNSGKS
jgi:DNA-binding transcriptional LysR family regulator